MRPTQADLLDCIAASLEEHIAPELTGSMAKSQLLTIQYLLHQLRLRVQHESEALAEFEADARASLGEVQQQLSQGGIDLVSDDIAHVLAHSVPNGPESYSAESLEERTARLRGCIDQTLTALDGEAGEPAVETTRRARSVLFGCIGRQLDREARWLQSGYSAPRR